MFAELKYETVVKECLNDGKTVQEKTIEREIFNKDRMPELHHIGSEVAKSVLRIRGYPRPGSVLTETTTTGRCVVKIPPGHTETVDVDETRSWLWCNGKIKKIELARRPAAS